MAQSGVAATTQYIQNSSFDPDTGVLVFQPVGYDGTNIVKAPSATLNIKITESGNYTYIGKAPVGTAQATAKWQCFRIDESVSGQTVILYADANANFDNVATDLTALTYS